MHVSALKDSKFLKRTDVGGGTLATIRMLSQENVAKEGSDPELKWCLHFDELEKPLVLNSTNAQIISKILNQEDTDDWTGGKVVLYDDPNVSFGGKLVGGIRVRAPKTTGMPKAAKPVYATPAADFHATDEDVPF